MSGRLRLRTVDEQGTLRSRKRQDLAAILFGICVTLSITGYQFGKSNHTVYLIDALRQSSPELLKNDWFTTQTLQYHGVFTQITRGLMRVNLLEPGFLVGFIGLVILTHLAWLRIVRILGGTTLVYLLSVVLFNLSAGGFGLGMYRFEQDSSFLPSNVANVAMLWGIYWWISGRIAWAGVALGIAGLFHLNHALVAIGLWSAMGAWSVRGAQWRAYLIGSVPLAGLCAINVVPALRGALGEQARLPLAEFVDLYVRLRHPHHYDPSSWPVLLWVSFLWSLALLPFVGATLASPWRPAPVDEGDASVAPTKTRAWRESLRITTLLLGLIMVALIGAGIFYVSEPLVQMSFWRFSIYVKLLTCTAAALLMVRWLRAPRAIVLTTCAILIGLGIGFRIARGHWIAMSSIPEDDSGYLELCDWAREHTPTDAVFLVPPQELGFRLRAQRAIVVNFKHIPQLSREMPAWRDRLQDVLEMPDLRQLPTPFVRTFAALRDRYESRSPQHLSEVARKYGARYIVVGHALDGFDSVYSNQRWFLYDLRPEGDAGVERTEMEKRILDTYRLRLEPEMSAYLLRRIEAPHRGSSVPVMGGDARTGVPIRRLIDLKTLDVDSSPR